MNRREFLKKSLEGIVNKELTITKKSFLDRLRNRITPYLLSLSILTGAYFVDLPKSFAEEKTKTEKESKFKIPDWLNLYMDMGYIYGKNYNFKSEMESPNVVGELYDLNLDIKGKNVYDVSVGASILSRFKNIPIFFDVNISNLYDGFRKKYSNSEIYHWGESRVVNWNTSHPFISCSIGSFKKYSNYIFNTAFSYSTNIKDRDENAFKNYAFSASISRLYKNFAITPVISFLKKNSNHIEHFTFLFDTEVDKHYKFNENIIGLELNISYAFKHITPYISFYDEIYNTQSIERPKITFIDRSLIKEVSNKKAGIIIKTGIYFSTSNILDWFKGVNGSIFHQNDVIEKIVIK